MLAAVALRKTGASSKSLCVSVLPALGSLPLLARMSLPPSTSFRGLDLPQTKGDSAPPESRTAAFLARMDVLQKAGLGAGRDDRHSLFWPFAL